MNVWKTVDLPVEMQKCSECSFETTLVSLVQERTDAGGILQAFQDVSLE